MNRNHKVHEYYNAAGNNSVYKGTSFRCTEWKSNTCYFNDEKYIDFVSIDNCVLMCKQSHVSDEYNRPHLQSVLVDGKTLVQFESAYWTLVLNGGTVTSLGAAIPSYPTDGNTYVLTSYDNKMVWAKVEASAGDGSEAGVSVASDEDSINFTFTLPKGKDGQDGTDGKDGVDGTNGEDGTPGEDGKPGKDGITPTTFLTSYVFRRGVENSEFSAPKGGNFENPYPTVDGTPTGERDKSWSDTVKLGTGSVYMSSCTFKSDNLSGNYIWSTPTKLSDSSAEQVEYLCKETISVGGKVCNNAVDIQEAFDHWNGVTYPYQFSTYANGELDLEKAEQLWRDAVKSAGFGIWGDDDTSDEPYYMARCYSKDNGATWSKWEVVRIKGEKGQNVTPKGTVEALPLCDDMEYKMGDSVVLQSAGNPLDGHMFIHTGDYCSTGNCDCWVDMGYTRGDTIHIKYANVVDKETATEANEFIYFDGIKNIVLCFDSELSFGDYIGISVNSSAESSDNPEDYHWQRWTGQDGWGYEYIYWATKEYKVPGIQNNNVVDEEFQKDGYLPYVSASTTEEKWFDDQPMISNDLPYVWRAERKKVNGKWTAFSDATLCAQFAISIDKVYDFYTISDTEVLCPEYADIAEHLSEEYFESDHIWYKTLPNVLKQGCTVYNLTVIVYTNGNGQVSCNAMYKIPVDGAKLSNVEPYYRLSNSNITPWYNIQKNTLDFKNEHFIYIKIKYNEEYQTNGCTGVFTNWYGVDDLFALEDYLKRFIGDPPVIEGVAVFENKRSRNLLSFTQVVKMIGYHGRCNITTIICDSTSVEAVDAVSSVLYPCNLYLLAPGININIFETLGIIQNVYVPEEYLLDYQFQGWTTSGTLTTSVENKYLWEQDKMTVENADGSTYAIATPPFILSWYESPGYTSYKFIASATSPNKPVFPEGEGWLDTVPMPNIGESVWVTSAFIYEDGRYETVWSEPKKLSDSQHFQVEYSNTYDGLTSLPKLEITGGNYESEWRQKAKNLGCGEWNDYVVNAKYMATCHISGQTTTDWTVCKIYGEDAYSLKLSNPVDQCYVSSNGKSWNSATTDVELYHGSKKVLEGVTFTYCAKDSADIQNVDNNTISIKGLSKTEDGISADTDYIVTAYVNGVSVATALFRVYYRVSDVDYDLYGLPTEVKYNADLGGYNIQSLLITVRKTDYNGTVTYNTLKELDIDNASFSVECSRDDSSDAIKPTKVNGKEYIYLPPNQDAQLFTIRLWDRGTLYDTHYITVVHDGKNGENALHLELTNEYDQVYCDDNITYSGQVFKTQIQCFDGVTDVTQNAKVHVFANSSSVKVDKDVSYNKETGVIEYSYSFDNDSLYASSDVIFTFTWNGISKTARVVKMHGTTDYDLSLNSTVVKKFSNGAYVPSEIEVNVIKTELNHPNAKKETVSVKDSGLEVRYRDLGATENSKLGEDGKVAITSDVAKVFELVKFESGKYITYDKIYVQVVKDGDPGESVYHIELPDEMDQVYVDAEGNSAALQTYTIKPELYYGKQHITDAKFYWKLDNDVPLEDKYKSSAILEYTIAKDTEVPGDIIIHMYYGTPESYHAHAKYTIVRLEESYDMDLVVTPTQLVQHTNSKFDYTNISIQIKQRNLKDQSEKQIDNLADLPNGYTLYDNNTELKSLNIPVDSKEHTITLKKGDCVIDLVTVNIVKDGKDGTGIDIVDSYLTAAELETAYLDNSIGNLIKGNAYVVGGNKLYVYGGERKEFNQAFTIIDYKGEDGYSSEQIFILSNSTDVSCPSPEGVEVNEWNELEYCPKDWSDTPLAVHAGAKYCYMAVRRYPAQQLTDGYNLFHGSKDINGAYSNKAILYSSYAEPGKDAVSKFKATAFIRTSDDISKEIPSGGDYNSPIPTSIHVDTSTNKEIQWEDGIPDGQATLWASTRTFYSDGTEESWSTPVKMTSTSTFEVLYSEQSNKPEIPTDDNIGSLWQNTGSEKTVWMATHVCQNGNWSEWTISKIKGEDGKTGDVGASSFKSIVFKRYTPTTENPSPSKPADDYGSYDDPAPAGGEWSDGIPSGDNPIFSSYRYFGINGGRNDSSWSDPVMMADTNELDVEYSSLEKPGDPTGHPNTNSNWGNTPNDPIWMATCTRNNGTWGNWVVTRIKGETGKAGDNGVSASHLELSNEFDQVWVNSNNTSHANQEYSTSIIYFEGVTPTKIIPKDVAISSGCTVTPNATGETPVDSVIYTITPPTTIDEDIHVNFTYNGITKTFTLKRLVGNMDYDLSVTPSTIVKKIDGTVAQDVQLSIIETNFSGGTRTITGDWPQEWSMYAISCSSAAYNPKYCESRGKYPGQFMRISSSGDVSGTNNHYNYFAPISAAKFNDLDVCTVYLLQNDSGWKIIDYVQIEVLNEIKGPQGETGETGAKGDKGDPGERGPIIYPAGIWSEETKYVIENDAVPYVVHDDKYYILIAESSIDDMPNLEESNGIWKQMNQFDSVFTKLLVAENGTIGQAVYSGDYMFSQGGVIQEIVDGDYVIQREANSGDYKQFGYDYDGGDAIKDIDINKILSTSKFVPNLLFDFKSGNGYLNKGDITFENGVVTATHLLVKTDEHEKQTITIKPESINVHPIEAFNINIEHENVNTLDGKQFMYLYLSEKLRTKTTQIADIYNITITNDTDSGKYIYFDESAYRKLLACESWYETAKSVADRLLDDTDVLVSDSGATICDVLYNNHKVHCVYIQPKHSISLRCEFVAPHTFTFCGTVEAVQGYAGNFTVIGENFEIIQTAMGGGDSYMATVLRQKLSDTKYKKLDTLIVTDDGNYEISTTEGVNTINVQISNNVTDCNFLISSNEDIVSVTFAGCGTNHHSFYVPYEIKIASDELGLIHMQAVHGTGSYYLCDYKTYKLQS